MADTFDIKGLEKFGELGERLKKDVTKQIDLAARTSINKTIDLITYGKVTGINASGGNGKGIVVKAARALRIPVEHIYYRTFVAGVKVTEGKGRGVKPYASLMIRGNDIVVSDLLLKGNDAKARYGFKSRKRKIQNKKRPNMKALAASARNKGSVTIAGRTYRNSILADGSYRVSDRKVGKLTMDEYYMQKLGALPKKLEGKQMLLFQRKGGKKQGKPYPVKVVKIRKQSVMNALTTAANSSIAALTNETDKILRNEVKRRMKKIGFDIK